MALILKLLLGIWLYLIVGFAVYMFFMLISVKYPGKWYTPYVPFIIASLLNGVTPPGIRFLNEDEQRELGDILEKARFKSGRRAGIEGAQKNVIRAYKDYISKVGWEKGTAK